LRCVGHGGVRFCKRGENQPGAGVVLLILMNFLFQAAYSPFNAGKMRRLFAARFDDYPP